LRAQRGCNAPTRGVGRFARSAHDLGARWRVMSERRKVTVVGAGNVGATCAQVLATRDYADVVLVDIVENLPQGKGLDINQMGAVLGYEPNVVGSNGYEETAGSEVVVITAGVPRKPGMSRDDLVRTNAGIVRSVSEQIARVAPNAIVVVVSNPLDVMCYVAMKTTGFPRERVLGMAGVLDTARYRTFLAQELDVSVEDIQAMVLGGHGDTMVPLVSYTTVSGIPVSQLLAADKLAAIVDRTRNGGAEIVAFLKTGSAYYAPSAAAVQMVEAIALDKRRILPCSAWLQGEFGLKDVFCGVPCKLGRNGLERIVQITLTDAERAELVKSAEAVRSTQAVVDAA
jgi:malate dehydrogenase